MSDKRFQDIENWIWVTVLIVYGFLLVLYVQVSAPQHDELYKNLETPVQVYDLKYSTKDLQTNREVIYINKTQVEVEVVQTPEDLQRGLSGRSELGAGKGMLFIFNNVDRHGIWMKDMLVPLDIIWFDEEGEITHFEENIEPESYPKVFYPKEASKYVLEVNAGFIEKHQILLENELRFKGLHKIEAVL